MARTFKAKIRKVGTSLGVLIPKDIVEREGIKDDDEVAISILKGRKINEVLKLFGTAGRTRSFERDRKDRSNRY